MSGEVALSCMGGLPSKKEFLCPNKTCSTSPIGGFDTKRELTDHKLMNSVDHFYCKKCDEDFKNHEEEFWHPVKSDNHMACPVCAREFMGKRGFDEHLKISHQKQHNVKCPGCQTVFAQSADMIRHFKDDKCSNRKDPSKAITADGFHASLITAHARKTALQHAADHGILEDPPEKPELHEPLWPVAAMPTLAKKAPYKAPANSWSAIAAGNKVAAPAAREKRGNGNLKNAIPQPDSIKNVDAAAEKLRTAVLDDDSWDGVTATPASSSSPSSSSTAATVAPASAKKKFNVWDPVYQNMPWAELYALEEKHNRETDAESTHEEPPSLLDESILPPKSNPTAWLLDSPIAADPTPTIAPIIKAPAATPTPATPVPAPQTFENAFPALGTGPAQSRQVRQTQAAQHRSQLAHPPDRKPVANLNTAFWNPHTDAWQPELWFNPLIEAYVCPMPTCDYTTRNQLELRQHAKELYDLRNTCQCPNDLCRRPFKTHEGVLRHLQSMGRKCRARERAQFPQWIHLVSGGFIKAVKRVGDGEEGEGWDYEGQIPEGAQMRAAEY